MEKNIWILVPELPFVHWCEEVLYGNSDHDARTILNNFAARGTGVGPKGPTMPDPSGRLINRSVYYADSRISELTLTFA